MVLGLIENAFVTQNIESIHFHSCSQAKLPPPPGSYQHPLDRKILPISPRWHFLKIYFLPQQKGGGEGNYGADKITKIKLVRVLVTSFIESHPLCTLHFLVPVLLCHNLD